MDKFDQVKGPAAVMRQDNVDTDIIFPARFLLLLDREGVGRYAFNDYRFDPDGVPRADFVLNRAPWDEAKVLIAGANFGCGSSREQAVWTLADFGIRCVIAASFGDIFFSNCGKNGVLAITLPPDKIAMLQSVAESAANFVIDLPTQTISAQGLVPIGFDIEPDLKAALMNGWDETDQIVDQHAAEIASFESNHRSRQPWLFVDE